jgi:L-seryl-tRNA(Ser) seleniumtransferase
MMHSSKEEIAKRAEAISSQIRGSKLSVERLAGESVVGGGAAPSAVLPTSLLAVSCTGLTADEIAVRLRANDPPVVARVEDGRVLVDLRTVFPEQEPALIAAIQAVAGS